MEPDPVVSQRRVQRNTMDNSEWRPPSDYERQVIERLLAAERAGVDPQSMLVDPGIGFGKTVEHNLALLRALPQIESELDRPIVLGLSRKSFIAKIIGSIKQTGIQLLAAERDTASHVLHGMLAGSCALLRVHDVPGAVAAVRLHHALQGGAHEL